MQKKSNIRLFVNALIGIGKPISLNSDQTHYLFNVMKKTAGDLLYCLDNQTGEYLCRIKEIGKKECVLEVAEKSRDFAPSPDIWLLFAPIKKDNTDFIIQKATELGVSKLAPVLTVRSIAERVKKERFISQSVEAAEQCRRLDLPQVDDIVPLPKLINDWDSKRILFFMDETLKGTSVTQAFSDKNLKNKPSAILVGPEGGFSEEELGLLRSKSFARGVNLGPRILRAETAAVAALSCWQALVGDWSNV